MADQYVLVWSGIRFINPNKMVIDNYGNKSMEFADGRGNVLVWRRDDLILDHDTGTCKPRDVDKKPIRSSMAQIPQISTQ